jgi:hypothetical protein
MGMGLTFKDIAEEQAADLQGWIGELSGEIQPEFDTDNHFSDLQKPAVRGAGVREIVSELVDLLERKNVLTPVEATALRGKLSE